MEHLVGIVNIDISLLNFNRGRDLDNNIVQHLVRVFEQSRYGCDRVDDRNYISAFVTPQDFRHLLQSSQTLRRDLELSLINLQIRPKVTSEDIQIEVLHGKHRAKAGEEFLPPNDRWWNVKLFVLDETSSDARDFICKEVNRFSHETKLSDGQTYKKVRYYENTGQSRLAQDSMQHLKYSKQRNLKQLLKRKKRREGDEDNYVELLDYLLSFPGMTAALELGNFHKYLALHCDRELLHYLKHIRKTWDKITGGDERVRLSVDIETVRLLERLAPATSIIDRTFISRAMRCGGVLFPSILDSTIRQSIERNLLGLPGMIPTIASFQENTSYLKIGASIIRSHILDPGLKKKELYQAMKDIWLPHDSVIEVQDGQFHPIEMAGEAYFKVAYLNVFLSAQRHFSKLSNEGPKKDAGIEAERGSLDTKYLVQFLRGVNRVGFSSHNINKTLREHESLGFPTPLERSSEDFDTTQHDLKHRWNRPFSKQYREIRCRLFLPEMFQALSETNMGPSTLFIQHDFINAFFDMPSFNDPSLLDRRNVDAQYNERDNLRASQILATDEALARNIVGSPVGMHGTNPLFIDAEMHDAPDDQVSRTTPSTTLTSIVERWATDYGSVNDEREQESIYISNRSYSPRPLASPIPASITRRNLRDLQVARWRVGLESSREANADQRSERQNTSLISVGHVDDQPSATVIQNELSLLNPISTNYQLGLRSFLDPSARGEASTTLPTQITPIIENTRSFLQAGSEEVSSKTSSLAATPQGTRSFLDPTRSESSTTTPIHITRSFLGVGERSELGNSSNDSIIARNTRSFLNPVGRSETSSDRPMTPHHTRSFLESRERSEPGSLSNDSTIAQNTRSFLEPGRCVTNSPSNRSLTIQNIRSFLDFSPTDYTNSPNEPETTALINDLPSESLTSPGTRSFLEPTYSNESRSISSETGIVQQISTSGPIITAHTRSFLEPWPISLLDRYQ